MDGHEKTRETLFNRFEFYDQCADYVVRNSETIYGPLFLAWSKTGLLTHKVDKYLYAGIIYDKT